MKNFDVLDRHLDIHRHHLLEASAGTGKTFSIQTIVARLLMDEQPLELTQILAVTFTRAAARELKARIRKTLEEACSLLSKRKTSAVVPDYLKSCMEKGEEAVNKAKKRLQHALHFFDQAQIFTIHAFCRRMLCGNSLESNLALHAKMGEEALDYKSHRQILHDFLRTEVQMPFYSPAQIDILLKEDPDQKQLMNLSLQSVEFADIPDFGTLHEQFSSSLFRIKGELNLNSQKILKDFENIRPYYKQQVGETQKITSEKISRFAALLDQSEYSANDFDQLIKDGCAWLAAFQPALLKKSLGPVPHYFDRLNEWLAEQLLPLLHFAGHPSALLIRMAKGFREHLQRFFSAEELLGTDDLLKKMKEALKEKPFLEKIRASFQAVIIDEFQDTDPLQWSLFKTLFLSGDWKGCLYLVGDPKQSIYSFRQADIYTYLDAANALGPSNCYALHVNYRSQPNLIKALNCLLSSENAPDLIALPSLGRSIPYRPVMAAAKPYEDKKGAIHFFAAESVQKRKFEEVEEAVFFPFIVEEIIRLRNEKGFRLSQFAVLVKDRHQAQRLANFFQKAKIPYLNQKGTNLADAPALTALIHLIEAILHPEEKGAVKKLLASPLFGWSMAQLSGEIPWETLLPLLDHWRESLRENGFAYFFEQFLRSRFEEERSVLQKMLSSEEGIDYYHDLQQISETVIEEEGKEWQRLDELVPFLDRFHEWGQQDDPRAKRFHDPLQAGVKIITLHYSKGLEFEVVFALGLAAPGKQAGTLIPIKNGENFCLTAVNEDSQAYKQHVEEQDAEKMRQLYVALTRAKFQLFIPFLMQEGTRKLKWGEASPLDLYAAQCQTAFQTFDERYEKIRQGDQASFFHFLNGEGKENGITFSIHQSVTHSAYLEEKESVSLASPKAPKAPSFQFPTFFMTSFTHLNTAHASPLVSAPHDFNNTEKTVHHLPASAETGVFLHSLLEKVTFSDFKKMKKGEAKDYLFPFIKNTSFKDWEEALGGLFYDLMHLPFDNFTLSDLSPEAIYREIPFLMPYEEKGVMKGVIDLAFCHNGLYYLLDWKSNWLGPSVQCYQETFMQKAMEDNGYFLQAQIYRSAFEKYLKLVESRPFDECFGGIYYVFIRGVQKGQQTGIYKY